MSRLFHYLMLPAAMTPFEERYLRRMNKIGLGFFWLHPPVFALVALLAGTSLGVAVVLSLGAMVGPMIAYFGFQARRPRVVGMIYGVTAMLMGGVLVYIGQGPMQIEMHFYFFAMLAVLAVFANPMVIIAATVTVAAHHFIMWIVLPRGVFNYDATFWTVVVHALFVVIESVAACFVARSFFDNVIGLEEIVTHRTRELDGRNRDMTRILDNVAQGFISVGFDGKLGAEWSHSLEVWFGEPHPGQSIWDYLYGAGQERLWMRMGFDSLADGLMPVELTLDQLPRRISQADREFRIDYQPIDESSLLMVVSDITAEVAREQSERAQRELIAVVEKAFRDRVGFTSFVRETEELVQRCTNPEASERADLTRWIHTLKGNTALFGVTSVSAMCHAIEEQMKDSGELPDAAARAELARTWTAFRERVERLLGMSNDRSLVVAWHEYQTVIGSMPSPEPAWATRMRDWGKTPTRPRLEQCADYARMLGERLGKTNLDVEIIDRGVLVPTERFDGVWSAFVHAIRNMVDHGIEKPAAREAAGKPAAGKITLGTEVLDGELRIEISDDGAGIDWECVALKARALGLPVETRCDLEEALFTSGVSTSDEVTDVSGRGVGMDALREACRKLGGRVEIHSENGKGTRIVCVLAVTTRTTQIRRLSSAVPETIHVIH